jgi:hypothetical protein
VRSALVLLVTLLLNGCGPSNPVTPAGTTLFEWDRSKSVRAGVRDGKLGTKTSKDYKITFDKKAPFVVSLHVEVAPIEFDEGGETVKQTTPVQIRATVHANDAWDLSGRCLEGPHYLMGPIDASGKMVSPMGMLQDCSIRFHRTSGVVFKSTYQLGRTLNISGNGTVTAFPADDVTIE